MAEQTSYEKQVESFVRMWDEQIERFKKAAKDAGPTLAKKYNEAISLLTANREATRRGLIQLDDPSSVDVCAECPGRVGREEISGDASEGVVEKGLQSDYDVARGPRKEYGPE